MSGPVKTHVCFICRNNAPSQPPRYVEFRTEGTKPDGSPKNVMYEPNSNNKHIHYPRPQAQQSQPQGQKPPVTNTPQTSLPIDRIQEDSSTQRMQPDAPVHKPTVPAPPIQKTYENNPDGSPKSWTMECDVCKQKQVPGQMIYGDAIGFDTTTQKYVWMIFDHDVSNPTQHKVIHVHREKPITQEPPAEVKKETPPGLSSAELMEVMKAGQQARDKEAEAREKYQGEIQAHADKMLKATQAILANQEMYMKALIRLINAKFDRLEDATHILTAEAKGLRELDFAEDAVIFDALTNYDKLVAATPTTADKLIKNAQPGTDFTKVGKVESAPVSGTCTNCGQKVADVLNHVCDIPNPIEDFKPTKEEMDAINAMEDETPDISDDRVFRI